MRLALVLPGGVDRSGEVRVIPAFVALIERLARRHDVEVFAQRQEELPGRWRLAGATVHNAGRRHTMWRTLNCLFEAHRRAPFDLVQSLFSGERRPHGLPRGRAPAATVRGARGRW